MLKVSINGPQPDPTEGTVCIIDLWRIRDGREPFQASYLVKTDSYHEALKSAVGIVEREKLDQ